MTRNQRTIWLAALGLVAIAGMAFFIQDYRNRPGQEIQCGDGARRTVDVRQFETQYSGYAVQFEAELKDRGKLATTLGSSKVRDMSDALQDVRELRRFVATSYNACAISKDEYSSYEKKFQALSSLERQLATFSAKEAGSELATKIADEYLAVARSLRQ